MNQLVPEVGWVVAFTAGVLSFLSPCVAPLVPGYLSYISGVSLGNPSQRGQGETARVLWASTLFVLGFSVVFVLLGASAAMFGGLLDEYRRPLNRIAGGFMIAMGLMIIGLFKVPMLYQERRFHLMGQALGPFGPVLLGMAFAFGWTPCVGPILASILFYASAVETVGSGALLLLIYSLGLGVPFILAGLGFTRMVGAFAWVKRHYGMITIFSGGLLIAIGILFLTDRFFYINIMALRLYYSLFYPG